MEEYLDYTVDRLQKRYSLDNPADMFYKNDGYRVFLRNMCRLLSCPDDLKK